MWPDQVKTCSNVFDPYDTIPYFLTPMYPKFLQMFHMQDGGVVLNCGLTVPTVTYNTVCTRLGEFVEYVFAEPGCPDFGGKVSTTPGPSQPECPVLVLTFLPRYPVLTTVGGTSYW